MKSTPVLVCIFLMICVTSAENLTCYNCLYYEGHKKSDPSCLDNPKSSSVTVCRKSSSVCSQNESPLPTYVLQAYGTEIDLCKSSGITNDTTVLHASSDSSDDNGNTTIASLILMCSNVTGSLDGKPIVIRTCAYGSKMFNNKCTKNTTLEFEGRNATDVLACFCSTEKCNRPRNNVPTTTTTTTTTTSTTTTTTPKPRPSAASSSHLTSYSLFAVAIFFTYKCYLSYE